MSFVDGNVGTWPKEKRWGLLSSFSFHMLTIKQSKC